MQKITITQDICGQRLDKFLARRLNRAPKAFIHKMLRKKNILLNDKRADGAAILNAGDIITLYLADATIDKFIKSAITIPGTLDIIYEDENIAIINKPANLLTQPDSPRGDSLLARLRHRHAGTPFAPVVINRLDFNTTGIVLCAKNLPAAQILAKLLHDREIEKNYLALCHGEIVQAMTLEGFQAKDEARNLVKNVPRGTLKQRVMTKVTPLEYNATRNITMLKIGLVTGRSHQIRAHLAGIGHPLVGDAKYGGRGAARQMLHAHEIAFGEVRGILGYLSDRRFTAPLPDDMKRNW